MRHHARPKADGFTLIELLVALAVMALLAVLAWRGLDGMVRARESIQQRAAQVTAVQLALLQWRADLDAMAQEQPAPGNGTADAATRAPRPLDWSGAVLRITRRDAMADDGALRVVAWTLRSGGAGGSPPGNGSGNGPGNSAGNGSSWSRWQSALIRSPQEWQVAWDQAALAANATASTGSTTSTTTAASATNTATINPTLPLHLTPALDWQIYFHRGASWSNAASSAEAGGALPDGVRLQLRLPEQHPLAGLLTQDWVRPTLSGNKS